MRRGLFVFVCFLEVHLKHFHPLSRLKYLLNLCLEGEVAYPFATARIDFQGGCKVAGTVAVMLSLVLGYVLAWLEYLRAYKLLASECWWLH